MPVNNLVSFYIPFNSGVSFSENETITVQQQQPTDIYVSSTTMDYCLNRWGYSSRPSSYQICPSSMSKEMRDYIQLWINAKGSGEFQDISLWITIGGYAYSGLMGYAKDSPHAEVMGHRMIKCFLASWRPVARQGLWRAIIAIIGFGTDWKKTKDPASNQENFGFFVNLAECDDFFDQGTGVLKDPMILPILTPLSMQNVIFFSFESYASKFTPFFLATANDGTPWGLYFFKLFTNKKWPNDEASYYSVANFADGTSVINKPTMLTCAAVPLTEGGRVANYLVLGPADNDGTFYASSELAKADLLKPSTISDMFQNSRCGTMMCDDGSIPSTAAIQYGGSLWFFSKSSSIQMTQLFNKDKGWAPAWVTSSFGGGAEGPSSVACAWNGLYVVSASGGLDVISRQPQGVDYLRDSALGTSGFDFFLKSYQKVSNPSMTRTQLAYDDRMNAVRLILSSKLQNNMIQSLEIDLFGDSESVASKIIPQTIAGNVQDAIPLLLTRGTRTTHVIGSAEWTISPYELAQRNLCPIYQEYTYAPKFLTTYFSLQGESRFQFVALIPRIERQFLNKELVFSFSYSTDEDPAPRFVFNYDMRGKALWDSTDWDGADWDGVGHHSVASPIRLGVFGRFIQIGITTTKSSTPFFIKGISVYAIPAGGVVIDGPFEGRLAHA